MRLDIDEGPAMFRANCQLVLYIVLVPLSQLYVDLTRISQDILEPANAVRWPTLVRRPEENGFSEGK